MITIIDLAIKAALAAGTFIDEASSDISALNIEQKKRHDYVSEVDRKAERIVVEHIKNVFPDHQIQGEEYGVQGDQASEYCWIIDPLDGTTNFLRSIAHYAVSISVLKNGRPEHGVIYDPAKKELFTASYGQGAFLNGNKISVSGLTGLKSGLLATGVPFNDDPLNPIEAFAGSMVGLLHEQTSGIRRLGAAALDLAYVAAGRYDGFWEANLKVWDIAAGVLIVTEAGGVVTDLHGGDDYLMSGHVLAAPSGVHVDMLNIIKAHY